MKSLKCTLLSLLLASACSAHAADDVVIVYDASGSMWGQIDGVTKVEIARDVLANLVNEWDASTNLGLVAYGHRRQGDCGDIETLIKPGPVNKKDFIATVNGLNARGKTPIAASIRHAAELLSWRDNPATIVLVSDGVETCNADPCELADELARQGVKLTAHVVGFDLEDEAHASLSCIAEATGGVFVPANNAAELQAALMQVRSVVQQQPAEPTPPPPDPEPKEATPAAAVTLNAPEQVTAGATFPVSWSPTVTSADYVTIVSADTAEGKTGNRVLVRDKTEDKLTAPAEPGLYEVRYVLVDGMRTAGSRAVEVVEGSVNIIAPEQVTAGSVFAVSWSENIHPGDYVTIVVADTPEGKTGNRILVRDKTEGKLTAPSEPGAYQLRYVLQEGMRTQFRKSIEVVEAVTTVSAPERVVTGALFPVSWSGVIHSGDYITIVPAGTPEGKTGNRILVRDNTEGKLTAPSESGLYEVRYVLQEGMKTIAVAPIEVTSTTVTITAPKTVRADTDFPVSWSDNIHSGDYITIVPAQTPEGKIDRRVLVRQAESGKLKAPANPGLYEVRYVLQEGMKTLGSAPVEVVAADAAIDAGASLKVPRSAAPGATIAISWTGGTDSSDKRVTLAKSNQADFSWITAQSITDETQLQLKMPDEPGEYEIRYLDLSNQKVLSRAIITVQ